MDRTDTLTLEECELSSPSYTSKRVGSFRDKKGPLREFEVVPFEGRLFFSTAESEGMLLLILLMIMMMMEDTME